MQDLLPFRLIKDDIILDRWSALVHTGQGYAQQIYDDTMTFLREVGQPDLQVRHQVLSNSFLDGLQGKRLDFLAATAATVEQSVVYMGAFDIGTSLSVHWYLTTRVGFWQTLLEKAPYVLAGQEAPSTLTPHLKLFVKDIAVRALASSTHTALAQAVQQLMESLGQDPTRLNRRTGFIGI